MTGFNPAVVDLAGSNLVLVVIVAVIALGALALAAMFRKEVLDADEGTDNMKNIALAVQEGANAYLTRQFRTLGIFAAVAFVALLALPADDIGVRIGRSVVLPVRRRLLRSRRLPRHVAGGQGQPPGGRSRQRRGSRPGHEDRVPHRRHGRHAHRGSRPARRQPRGAHLPGRGARTCSRASASVPPCSPCSCESVAASSPRRPTSAPTSSARSSRTSPRTTRATRPPSPTTWATTSATAPAWRPTCSSRTP